MQAIVAVSQSWGIGKGGDLLFRLPSDLRRFKAMTTGHTVIMGRKTRRPPARTSPSPAPLARIRMTQPYPMQLTPAKRWRMAN